MDSLFLLEKNARISLLKTIAQAFGCTYICLWSYLPPPDHCLFSMEGWCNEDYNRPSSSTSSFPKRLFDEYRQSFYTIENSCVPGFAFKEGLPYLELHDTDLLNLASNGTQRQFYQEAGIKTAVFNGCKTGEIELGMSIPPQFNMEMEIRKLFAEDFIQQFQLREAGHLPDQSRPSSSSSSLRSLSMGSPEYSALGQVNTMSTSYRTDAFQETPIHRATKPTFVPLPTHHQSMQGYSQSRNFQLPTPASADAAMARAMIAVMSSPSSSSTAYEARQTHRYQHQATNQRGAFKRYVPSLTPKIEIKPKSHSQNMIMRALAYLRTMKAPMPETRPTGPTSNQLHHMISERRRREKLNESFQALKSLLPPGSKKDKASVLANTRLYLSSLKDQVSELQEKNRLLEIQLAPTNAAKEVDIGNERTVIRVTEASESSSESRVIELHVMVREEDCEIVDLLLHLLECLNQMQGVSFVSMEADTQLHQTNSFHRAILRLKIKASDWNEESFKEAMTRAVADVARRKTSGS